MTAERDDITVPIRFQEFRETEPYWNPRIGENWEYQGQVHHGKSCIIAHYHCTDEDPPHTRDLAVKINFQRRREGNRTDGYPEGYAGHRFESEFLHSLSGFYTREVSRAEREKAQGDETAYDPRRPQSIVRQYSSQWVDVGRRGRGRNEISFLEFCPGLAWGGERWYDLEVFDRPGLEPLSEIDIWAIFKQFTRMIMMLDCGNDVVMMDAAPNERQRPDWETHEICHYDIEPRNICIGYRESDEDRIPMLKLCDFGDALQVPSLKEQDHAGRYKFPNQPNSGREGFRPPEAVIGDTEPLRPFRHGTCSNIFQFANIIRCLMHQDQSEAMHVLPEEEDWIEALPSQYEQTQIGHSKRTSKAKLPLSYGRMRQSIHDVYGGELRRLVTECMRESPSLRPHAKELWMRVRAGYEHSIAGRAGPHDEANPRRTLPPLHPIFAATPVCPTRDWRAPVPDWIDDAPHLPLTPICASPTCSEPADYTYQPNLGDDLPTDLHPLARSRPQIPLRHPHGPPILEARPSVNIPERGGNVPGSLARNLLLMEYYDRLGQMWMGEENYWSMLEAGLDPRTYNWEMRIPDPERDFDREPLSGTEYDEGDEEEDWDWDRGGERVRDA
ncbi:hypothetical protein DSL72_009212 [Monilinia vaccinii-corymbosi]|uniref:Protein kinase domain-containing protein n=1 Tax=Monilinia vaccinii-corymbosi TaxID=61207 RepID=A0A8A3PQF1_9HELO|nr:hypothetical protein DSL72_009212 [Monilinia vaccinii-corymbosi]